MKPLYFEMITDSICTFNYPVPTCKPEYPAASKCSWGAKKAECKEEKGNNPMTDSEVSRNYLVNRLDTASRTKRNEFVSLFNLYVQTQPKSYKDLIDWIKNDKFKLDDKQTKRIDNAINEEDGAYYGSFTDGIIWTGAAKIPDNDGYTAADVERTKRATAVKDVIYTSDAAAGLKALQDFESWTPATTTVQ